MSERSSDKRERLTQALERGLVMIHLDARRPGVVVPAQLSGEAHLRLNLSYRFEAPEILLNDSCVRATLSFSGRKFRVTVPWTALFAIRSQVTQEFWTYPDDVPRELLEGAPAQTQHDPTTPDDPAPRRHLRVVK